MNKLTRFMRTPFVWMMEWNEERQIAERLILEQLESARQDGRIKSNGSSRMEGKWQVKSLKPRDRRLGRRSA